MCSLRTLTLGWNFLLITMPPKAAPTTSKKSLLGRPSNNVKTGIVGLPNVGKSTFFNLLCGMSVAAENFPFCTIGMYFH